MVLFVAWSRPYLSLFSFGELVLSGAGTLGSVELALESTLEIDLDRSDLLIGCSIGGCDACLSAEVGHGVPGETKRRGDGRMGERE